ncbi:FtsW/RodA/SpoVE family cell cycle protein [Clostridium oryzae]|uniref:Lipid II flippase FtsW n=1 Tax=Clostridium oryzae TaxID=1450648 RepID=A0A1V4ICD1_9CLOT|nr:FtsW/RodA/SpoVE family cell cycle protein [Clostridium oryzae]OPJ57668.1 lipid II flippase FtsW [Clostridium oryzae]
MVNSKVEEYLQEICSFVKFKKAHKEIRAEILNHIEEKTEDLISKGFIEEEASKKALIEMGQAEVIGKQLNESHKAAPEWSILIITVVFSLLGVLIAYFMLKNGTAFYPSAFKKSSLFSALGYIIIFTLYFFDYKKLEKHSGKLFIAATLLLLLQLLLAHTVSGRKNSIELGISSFLGVLTFDATELSLFLYVISLSKLIRRLDLKNVKGYLYLTIMLLLPITLYVKLNLPMPALTYFIVFIVLMFKSKVNLAYTFSTLGVCIAGVFFLLFSRHYLLERLLNFINSRNVPDKSNYISIQINKLLYSTGLLGHGFSLSKQALPSAESEFVLPYIIYTLGWLAGISLIVLVFVFLMRMFITANSVKDTYGRLIIQGFMCIFAIEFIWNILMVFGLLPITGMVLPFISYGGSRLIVQMAAIGLILSIYKCKSISYVCN